MRTRRAPRAGRRAALEQFFDVAFEADHRLATYGSLAPGRPNHHVLEAVGGTWTHGLATTGELVESGWGASLGFPALRWRTGAPRVELALLISPALPAHWARLDAFEGPEYIRILVPLSDGAGFETVANLYQLAEPQETGC